MSSSSSKCENTIQSQIEDIVDEVEDLIEAGEEIYTSLTEDREKSETNIKSSTSHPSSSLIYRKVIAIVTSLLVILSTVSSLMAVFRQPFTASAPALVYTPSAMTSTDCLCDSDDNLHIDNATLANVTLF